MEAVALGLIGFVAMLLTTNVPIGSVLATTVWSASASWALGGHRREDAAADHIHMHQAAGQPLQPERQTTGHLLRQAGAEQDLAHRDEQRQRGSSAATCATIGKIALPELEKRGYDPGISLARSPAPARSGCRSRPRSPMVIYAVTANVSVLQVFLGGFLPGFLVMALYSGYIIAWSLLNPSRTPPRDPPLPFRYDTQASIPKNITFVNKAAFDASTSRRRTRCPRRRRRRNARLENVGGQGRLRAAQDARHEGASAERRAQGRFEKVGEQLIADWLKKAGPDGQAIIAAYKK